MSVIGSAIAASKTLIDYQDGHLTIDDSQSYLFCWYRGGKGRQRRRRKHRKRWRTSIETDPDGGAGPFCAALVHLVSPPACVARWPRLLAIPLARPPSFRPRVRPPTRREASATAREPPVWQPAVAAAAAHPLTTTATTATHPATHTRRPPFQPREPRAPREVAYATVC